MCSNIRSRTEKWIHRSSNPFTNFGKTHYLSGIVVMQSIWAQSFISHNEHNCNPHLKWLKLYFHCVAYLKSQQNNKSRIQTHFSLFPGPKFFFRFLLYFIVICLFCLFVFRISLSTCLRLTWTHYGSQVGLELTFLMLQPPKSGDYWSLLPWWYS